MAAMAASQPLLPILVPARAAGDGLVVLEPELGEGAGDLLLDEVGVGRGALDDAPEREDGVEPAGLEQALDGERELGRAGDADERDVAGLGAVAQEAVLRALEELFGEEAVEAAHGDAELHAGGGEGSCDFFHGCVPQLARMRRASR